MRKRVYSVAVLALAFGAISVATYFAAQKAGTRKTSAARQSRRAASNRRSRTRRAAGREGLRIRAADPNRAPQKLVDQALYTNEDFFGANASVARPFSDGLARISALIDKYPKDSRLRLEASRLAEFLGQYDRATAEMVAYADLKTHSPNSLRRLADYYHYRALFPDEVRTLAELAKALPVGERAPVYKRAAKTVRAYAVKGFEPATFFAELVAADPSNIQPVKDYVQELRLAKKDQQALKILEQYQPGFPNELEYFLKTRSQIAESNGDRKTAENVYDSAFDPNWPRAIAGDYYELLRRFGRYRIVRRALQEKFRSGADDIKTAGRLFTVFSYEGNYQQAARVLGELEKRRGRADNSQTVGGARWTSTELETAAAMFASIGYYDQASRYLYTLYLGGGLSPGSDLREDALYRLFKVMLDAAGTPTRVAGGDLSFYRDVAEIDQNPGFLNGVLSLILSGSDVSQEFETQQKAAAGYFNRAFSYRIFTAYKQEFPESNRLGDMYLGVVTVFSSLGEYKLAIETGREFMTRFPESPNYARVALSVADSYVSLKDRTGERKVLADLLDKTASSNPAGLPLVPVSRRRWSYGSTPELSQLIDRIRYKIEAYSDTYDPTEDRSSSSADEESQQGDDEDDDESGPRAEAETDNASVPTPGAPSYSSVLERYVSSLAADDKKTETVALFWGQIKKHPKEEGLYERFLQWLGQAQLINEQLKAYNAAVSQFDSNTWYHRLARWYVRQKRGRELNTYAKKLIDVFDEDEITDYLIRFAGYGSTAKGDDLDWDERFAYDIFSYAHNHFPRNLFFVRGMLTYLARNDTARWERLSAEYFFADRSISDPYLAWLSKQGQLRQRYQDANRRASGRAASSQSPGLDGTFAYAVFAADAGLWLSHHDEALGAYRRLAELYPGDYEYSERLAELTRSFGQTSDKLFEESASLYSHLADTYPLEHDYRIKAGEVYAQLGDFGRAGEEWDKLAKTEPGERKTYLEVATVYWDYYQYDKAIQVFKDLREVTADPSIYAYRMGAVYEGKGELDHAIAEYVKVLDEPGTGRDTVGKRLAQLSRRPGVADKISVAFQKARAASPNDWELIIGYASYQAERGQVADALAMLRTEVSHATDVGFLETTRDLFRAILRPEDEQQVIARLSVVARDEREAMTYRLQLAAFLEQHNQVDDAIAIIDKLISDFPTNVGVIEESSQFYWRAGLLDRALDLYKRTIAIAVGSNKRSFTLQLARMQSEANKLGDAEATLRAVYAEDHSDTQAFGELAKVLGAENKLEELSTLYQEAFKEARESGLGGDETRARIVDMRVGLIKAQDALGRYDAAVDQYIETINAYPEDAERLQSGLEYAEQHGLVPRMVAYYEKLSRESYKNYRWQIVLGRIYERLGNLGGAAEQYKIAVVNEPQRPDLRFNLASVLTRQRRYDEAIAVLRDGWTLAGRDPSWLTEVAQIQIRQGKRDEAVRTVRQALAAKQNATSAAKLSMAAKLATWGLDEEAVRIYEETFNALPKTLKDEYVGSGEVTGYVQVLTRSEPVARVFQKMERLRSVFQAIGANSKDSDAYKAKNIVSAIDGAMRAEFGRGVVEYATAAETSELGSALQSATAKLASYLDAESLRRYLGIARGALLVDVEEQIQTRLKDAAFDARPKNSPTVTAQDNQYYSELRLLIQFYDRHAKHDRAAETLSAEQQRDPYKNRFDYDTKIADEYRLAGNTQGEIDALRKAYASASGDLVVGQTDWVERYFELLYSTGAKGELQRIASLYNPHQLQLINFLIGSKEQLLALDAIERAHQPPAWVASRSAEVGLFLKDSSPDIEPLFRTALGWKPIGQLLGRKAPAGKELVGDEWFLASRNFGYWLGMVGREADSRKFVTGEIEGHPTDARAQMELAAYYLNHRNPSRAAEHTQLAAEKEPGSTSLKVLRGKVALANRDRKGAIDAWNSIISPGCSPTDAEAYLKVMADNGMLAESLTKLGSFISAYVNRSHRDSGDSQIENVKPLIRGIADRSRGDSTLQTAVASFFAALVNDMSSDTVVSRMLIDESLLSDAALGPIYRTVHQRFSEAASRVFGTEQYDGGYYDGNTWVYPAKDLAEFRKRFIDYLIRQRSFDEARLLIASIKREQEEIRLAGGHSGGEDDSSSDEDRYDWVPLASAVIEIRGGGDAARAVAELRRYCGLQPRQGSAEAASEEVDRQRSLKAYALLMAEHKETDAAGLLYDYYRAAVRAPGGGDASYVGLARIEAERGHPDEALRLLKLMAERSTNNIRALALAAETSARINRFDDAIDYREQIAQANPADAVNRLELARLLAASGQTRDALERLAVLIRDRVAGNTVRAQAAEVVGDVMGADRGLIVRATELFSTNETDGTLLALAAVREANGDADGARTVLRRINGGPLSAVAWLKIGLLDLAGRRTSDATESFERALQIDPDGRITDSLLFKGASPRAQLVALYSTSGRDAAAISLAEGDDSQRDSYISTVVRNALQTREQQPGASSNFVFEPSFEDRSDRGGLKTIAELSQSAISAGNAELLAAVVESTARLNQYDRAIAVERARVGAASRSDEKANLEKRLAELIAANRARTLRLASRVRFDRNSATPSIYAAAILE
jgi:predicted Zn-dependent protease